jgi:predicted transcriptional regulator
MSVTTVRLQAEVEQERWKQTLEAMESAAQGKVLEASEVHAWLNSWGTENELDAPGSGTRFRP